MFFPCLRPAVLCHCLNLCDFVFSVSKREVLWGSCPLGWFWTAFLKQSKISPSSPVAECIYKSNQSLTSVWFRVGLQLLSLRIGWPCQYSCPYEAPSKGVFFTISHWGYSTVSFPYRFLQVLCESSEQSLALIRTKVSISQLAFQPPLSADGQVKQFVL